MKKFYLLLSVLSISATVLFFNNETTVNQLDEKKAINAFLDDWHAAAAKADTKGYFGKIAEDGIYIGTDATENWNKKEFMAFAKPYFDLGKGWDFRALERNIYFSADGKTVWFDELLDTWMKACRGSGVLVKDGKSWKIKHYVLSMTVPNDVTNEVLPIKGRIEDALIARMKAAKKQ